MRQQYDAVISLDLVRPLATEPAHRVRRRHFLKYSARVLCLDFDNGDDVPDRAVLAIVQFAQQLSPGMKIMIHCRSGLVHAPAAALILLREHGLGQRRALAEVLRIQPRATPSLAMGRLYTQLVTDAICTTGFDVLEWSTEDEEIEVAAAPTVPAITVE